jgi:hypothetical protein
MSRRRRDPRMFVAGLILGAVVMGPVAVAARSSVPWAESGRVALAAPALVAQRAPWACTAPADPATCLRIPAGVLIHIEALNGAQRPSQAVLATLSDVSVELGGDPLTRIPSPIPTLAPGPTIAPPLDLVPLELLPVPVATPVPPTTSKVQAGCVTGDGRPC